MSRPKKEISIKDMEYIGFFNKTKNKIYRVNAYDYYLTDPEGNIINRAKSYKDFFEENSYFPLDKSKDGRYNKRKSKKGNVQ